SVNCSALADSIRRAACAIPVSEGVISFPVAQALLPEQRQHDGGFTLSALVVAPVIIRHPRRLRKPTDEQAHFCLLFELLFVRPCTAARTSFFSVGTCTSASRLMYKQPFP